MALLRIGGRRRSVFVGTEGDGDRGESKTLLWSSVPFIVADKEKTPSAVKFC